MNNKMENKWHFDTIAVHGGQYIDKETYARAPPIYQTTSYVFKDTQHAADLFSLKIEGNIYTRIMNPTTAIFERRMALLEKGIGALATASGQAAETIAILNITKPGDEIISSSDLYGGTYNLFNVTLRRLGINVKFVDQRDPNNFKKEINEKTKLIFAETLGNPRLDVLKITEISEIAHENNIPLVVDNTVTTPYLINPISYGADIIIHSATKYIGGHGTSIGGVIIDSGSFNWSTKKFSELNTPDLSYHGLIFTEAFGKAAFIARARVVLLRDIGPALSPFNAFLFLQGLETLPLRMKKHCENALQIANFLKDHPKIQWVNYPGLSDHPSHYLAKKYFNNKGFGGLISFGIKGGTKEGIKFIEHVKLFSHLANIGDAKSLCIHPASTTHQQLSREERISTGVTDDLIRLSIGIEDPNDLIEDLDQALKNV